MIEYDKSVARNFIQQYQFLWLYHSCWKALLALKVSNTNTPTFALRLMLSWKILLLRLSGCCRSFSLIFFCFALYPSHGRYCLELALASSQTLPAGCRVFCGFTRMHLLRCGEASCRDPSSLGFDAFEAWINFGYSMQVSNRRDVVMIFQSKRSFWKRGWCSRCASGALQEVWGHGSFLP